METLKSWCLGICYASLLCAAVMMLAPQKRTGNLMKLLCSLTVAAAFILPLLGLDKQTNPLDGLNLQIPSYNSSYNGYTAGLEYLIFADLTSAGLSPVSVNLDEVTAKVILTLPQSHRDGAFMARSLISEKYSLETEIIFAR